MASESIITSKKCCFYCGSERDLERHHIFKGVALRRQSEKHGLWIYLCPICHRDRKIGVHGMYGHEKDETLKMTAEYAWMEKHGYIDGNKITDDGMKAWLEIFGKNYI